MDCPYCNSTQTKCLDSRQQPLYRRRRYECFNCNQRFTTHEIVVEEMQSTQESTQNLYVANGNYFTLRRFGK